MHAVGHQLDRQCLSQHARLTDGAVIGEHLDDFTCQLSGTAPGDRVGIHRHTRVAAVANQRVAHGLQVDTVHAHLAVAVHLAVDGVGIDVERLHPHGIGMQVDSIFLRIVLDEGVASGKALTGLLVVDHLSTGQLVLVLLIDIHHIAIAAVVTRLAIIK